MNRADLDRWLAWAEGRSELARWETAQSIVRELVAAIPPTPAVDKVLADLEAVTSLDELLRAVRHAESAADRAESAASDVSSDIGRLARALEQIHKDRAAANRPPKET